MQVSEFNPNACRSCGHVATLRNPEADSLRAKVKQLEDASFLNQDNEKLRAQFKMKQDDWIEACKEVDSLRAEVERLEVYNTDLSRLVTQVTDLRAKLDIATKALEEIYNFGVTPTAVAIAAIADKALAQIQVGIINEEHKK